MNNNMLFSILIPAYKAIFLRQAINSIMAQTYEEFEIVIVDDNSPEDLKSIVDTFKDPRIRYYRNKVGFGAVNVVGNWNKCLEYANGDYVICMGDDDELSEKCLENYVELIDNNPGYNVYHTRLAFINEKSQIFDIQEERPKVESVYSAIWHTWRKERRHALGDWLFNTNALKQAGGYVFFPCAWGSDGITAFSLASERGIVNSSYLGFRYRVSQLTISSNDNSYCKEKVKAWGEIEKWYEEFLKEQPKEIFDILYWNYIRENLHHRMIRNKRCELQKCFNSNLSSVFWWLRHCKEYGLSNKNVLMISVYVGLMSLRKIFS